MVRTTNFRKKISGQECKTRLDNTMFCNLVDTFAANRLAAPARRRGGAGGSPGEAHHRGATAGVGAIGGRGLGAEPGRYQDEGEGAGRAPEPNAPHGPAGGDRVPGAGRECQDGQSCRRQAPTTRTSSCAPGLNHKLRIQRVDKPGGHNFGIARERLAPCWDAVVEAKASGQVYWVNWDYSNTPSWPPRQNDRPVDRVLEAVKNRQIVLSDSHDEG